MTDLLEEVSLDESGLKHDGGGEVDVGGGRELGGGRGRLDRRMSAFLSLRTITGRTE